MRSRSRRKKKSKVHMFNRGASVPFTDSNLYLPPHQRNDAIHSFTSAEVVTYVARDIYKQAQLAMPRLDVHIGKSTGLAECLFSGVEL